MYLYVYLYVYFSTEKHRGFIIVKIFLSIKKNSTLKENSKVCFCISKTNLPMVDYTAKSPASSHLIFIFSIKIISTL